MLKNTIQALHCAPGNILGRTLHCTPISRKSSELVQKGEQTIPKESKYAYLRVRQQLLLLMDEHDVADKP